MNAGRIATSYRWLEYAVFGLELERARFDFLSKAADARRVLIIGEGDGRFLAQLLHLYPLADVVVIETSGRMIELACRRVPLAARSRVQFHRVNAATESLPAGPFDLAVTHFFLDVLDEPSLRAVISKISSLLTPGGAWLISEFQEPAGMLRRQHARLWLAAMYRFFALTTGLQVRKLPPYREILERSGWLETAFRERRYGLIRSQLWRRPPPPRRSLAGR